MPKLPSTNYQKILTATLGALFTIVLSLAGLQLASLTTRITKLEAASAKLTEVRNDVKWLVKIMQDLEDKIDLIHDAHPSARITAPLSPPPISFANGSQD